jgi:type II secretion system protein N
MSRPKTILLYVGVVLLATALFLYLRFPADTVKDFISAKVSQSTPGMEVTIEKLSPKLPTGTTLENVELEYEKQLLLTVEQAKISARPSTLMGNNKAVSYLLSTSGGEVKGRAIFMNDVAGPSVDVKARFSSIQLGDIPAIETFSGYKIEGILDGIVNVNGSDRNGTAQTAFTISQCAINLVQPLLGLEKLNFQLIEIELAMIGQRVRVKKCNLNGEEVDGRITGSLTVRNPYGLTRLNLSGVLKPQPAFSAKLSKKIPVALLSGTNIQRKGIPFKITGTIDRPGYSLK